MEILISSPFRPTPTKWIGCVSSSLSVAGDSDFVSEFSDNFSFSNLENRHMLSSPEFSQGNKSSGSTRRNSIGLDSGYGSGNKKTSRWVKINENDLHSDVRSFLKKNIPGFKIAKELPIRKSTRFSPNNKILDFVNCLDKVGADENLDKLAVAIMM